MSKSLPSLSIFFPAYNDAGTIASMVLTAKIAAQALTDDYEIIVINDGSHDHTALILDELEQQIVRLRVIQHPRNLGYGAALRSGEAQHAGILQSAAGAGLGRARTWSPRPGVGPERGPPGPDLAALSPSGPRACRGGCPQGALP
jgi:hypothetical protein